MLGIFRFFRDQEKQWHLLDDSLTAAFQKVKDETNHVFSWLSYFRQKDSSNDQWHNATSQEIKNHGAIIQRLTSRLSMLEEEMRALAEQKNMPRTSPGTSQGHLKDMSPAQKAEKEPQAYDKGLFSASEAEILNILYHAAAPLGYDEIAKQVNKTRKSIRNLIYEMRRKKVEIKDQQIGFRQKGFFLAKETKIKISGR